MSHVYADSRIRAQAVGNHSRANAAHFFLHGIDEHHVPGDGLFQLAQLAGYFRQDEAAQPVVQSPAYQLVFIHQHGAVAVNAYMAHAQTEFRYFLVGGGAYINVISQILGSFSPGSRKWMAVFPVTPSLLPGNPGSARGAPVRWPYPCRLRVPHTGSRPW